MRLYQQPQGRVPDALADKYTNEPWRYWERFYRRNADRFYKDRHYFEHEWPQLLGRTLTLLEVGCGVGNTVYPLLELNPALTIYACDLSATAVALVRAHPNHAAGKVTAFIGDITATANNDTNALDAGVSASSLEPLPARTQYDESSDSCCHIQGNGSCVAVPPCILISGQSHDREAASGTTIGAVTATASSATSATIAGVTAPASTGRASTSYKALPVPLSAVVPVKSVDFCTMVFVLSAVAPEKQAQALLNVACCLQPGSGRVLFRDYAHGDMAQTRLHARGQANSLISQSFYVRSDGTCCYYFTEDGLRGLFAACGFVCEELNVLERSVENRKRGITMERRWVQGTFRLLAAEEDVPLQEQHQQQRRTDPSAQQHHPSQRPRPQQQCFHKQGFSDHAEPSNCNGRPTNAAGSLAEAVPCASSVTAELPQSLPAADEETSAPSSFMQRHSCWHTTSPEARPYVAGSDCAAGCPEGTTANHGLQLSTPGDSQWWPVHVGNVWWQCAADNAAGLESSVLLARQLATSPELVHQRAVLVLGDGSSGSALIALVAAKYARRVLLSGRQDMNGSLQPQQATLARNSHLIVAERVRYMDVGSDAACISAGRLPAASSGTIGLVARVLPAGNGCCDAALAALQAMSAMCSSSAVATMGGRSSSNAMQAPMLLLCVPAEHAGSVMQSAAQHDLQLAADKSPEAQGGLTLLCFQERCRQ